MTPEQVGGIVRRETWREVRLRGDVPIILSFREREVPTSLADAGEHHLFLRSLAIDGQIDGFPPFWEEEATFRIDWDRAVPERWAAEILQDATLLARWRSLSYEEACDLIAPGRRARSPRTVARRASEALDRLRAGGPPAPR